MIPASISNGLQLPVIAAPMFLVSGPELVIACCQQGIIGTFPALNQRTTAGFNEWLLTIREALRHGDSSACFGVNLIVHRSNPRLEADLEVCVAQQVPLIITSLGAVSDVVARVHAYGGKVFHDVTTIRHAQKAVAAGVDGLILVCAGAGGHAGLLNPFAFTAAVRKFFNGTLILAGCINRGHEVAAARMLGADLAYMGTRFIATQESRASEAYKQMLLRAAASDVTYTPAVSGVPGNFLTESLLQGGYDLDALHKAAPSDAGAELATRASGHDEARAWRDVWSAGQGVGAIDDLPSVAELVQRLRDEYAGAMAGPSSCGSSR